MSGPRHHQIAFAFPIDVYRYAGLIGGIVDYARKHTHWTFSMNPETYSMPVQRLKGWAGDGVFAAIYTKTDARIAADLKLPVVNISGALDPVETQLPSVTIDNEAVGRMAAEHFLERGFRRFGYYGLKGGVWYSQKREDGFAGAVQAAGHVCSVHSEISSRMARTPMAVGHDELEQWLKSLKPPVGILACSDARAGMVVEACRRIGLRVPDDVAVIGVDNDQLACEFCDPPLTSISRNGPRAGYEAAALLDRLIRGEPAPAAPVLIPPDSLARRRSTDVLAIEDERIAESVRYIRQNSDKLIGVESILEHIPMSRRWLEHGFKQHVGKTPYEYISHVRVEQAKKHLLDPSHLKLSQVAQKCGFPDVKRMNIVFQRLVGQTPRQYRLSHATAARSVAGLRPA